MMNIFCLGNHKQSQRLQNKNHSHYFFGSTIHNAAVVLIAGRYHVTFNVNVS